MTTQINFLPWRDAARMAKKKKLEEKIMLAVVLGFCCVGVLHLHDKKKIIFQDKRNVFLQTELNKELAELGNLNKQHKAQEAIKKELEEIFTMRKKSYEGVLLMDTLARVMVDGVTLSKIQKRGDILLITGRAKSNLEVTSFMKNIADHPLFKQPELTEMSVKENTVGEERIFQLKVLLKE